MTNQSITKLKSVKVNRKKLKVKKGEILGFVSLLQMPPFKAPTLLPMMFL